MEENNKQVCLSMLKNIAVLHIRRSNKMSSEDIHCLQIQLSKLYNHQWTFRKNEKCGYTPIYDYR